MLSISFACIKSRINKSGQSPIQLWINVDGRRATTLLDIKSEPKQFQKALKSNQPNPIQRYCNSVRAKITDFYAASACNGINPTPKQIIEFVKNGFAVKQYMLYDLFTDFLLTVFIDKLHLVAILERGRFGYLLIHFFTFK